MVTSNDTNGPLYDCAWLVNFIISLRLSSTSLLNIPFCFKIDELSFSVSYF